MILITGAGGFLGTALTRVLLKRQERVRCLVRRAADQARLAALGAEVMLGDVLDPSSLGPATAGVRSVYHFVHGIEGEDRRRGITVEMIDQQGTANLLRACHTHGTRRFLYVSILGTTAAAGSRVLASRWQTEELIRASGLDFTILRTGFVVGRGSRGFETFLALVTRFPVVVLPGNRDALHQPIALSDLLSYLTRCLDEPRTRGRTFEAGGEDRLSYGTLAAQAAQTLGRRRLIVNLPLGVIRPLLSLGWGAGLGRAGVLLEMITSMQGDMVCTETGITEVLPGATKPFRDSLMEYLTTDPVGGEPYEDSQDHRHRFLPSRGAHP